MASPRVCASILGATSHDLVNLLRVPSERFDSQDIDRAEGPPKKRARLTNGTKDGTSSPQPKDFVVLASFGLDVIFTADSDSAQVLDDVDSTSVEDEWDVTVRAIIETAPSQYDIVLANPTTGRCMTLEALSDTLHQDFEDWQIALGLGTRMTSRALSTFRLRVPRSDNKGRLKLRAKILWRIARSLGDCPKSDRQRLLERYFATGKPNRASQRLLQDFYESVHVPPTDQEVHPAVQSDLVDCQLYPFQRRTVNWLLHREGMEFNSSGRLTPYERPEGELVPPSFYSATDAEGRPFHFSHLLNYVTDDISNVSFSTSNVRGGILSEEMGLGKTVELISLICLHRRTLPTQELIFDPYSHEYVRPSSATLIITPPTILQQWQKELASRAPSLKVMEYKGVKRQWAALGKEWSEDTALGATVSNDELVSILMEHDVVLTTYSVLSSEIHYANAPLQRNLRHLKRYEAKRSPLVQISWWRVCLDEAQMVENGVSNAATVARRIPRCNAWAVTGTPLRKDIRDLLGLLIFLRYEPYCETAVWNSLVQGHKDAFRSIFEALALRHTKDLVRDDLRLPPQTRLVITVPFTQIEEQHYSHVFQQMCDDCGLDTDGGPLSASWDPDNPTTIEKMRGWLRRLRQTCLHPEVGGINRRALGYHNAPLRSVGEVLEVMIDQNDVAVRTEERSHLMSRIKRGQMFENKKETQKALDIWMEALRQVQDIVADCRASLMSEMKRHADVEGKSVGTTKTPKRSDSDSEDEEDEDMHEKMGRIGAHRLRLRSALEIEHICTFFAANAYYQLKTNPDLTEPDSDRFAELGKTEEEFYEKAKLLRKEILSEVLGRVNKLIDRMGKQAKTKGFTTIPEILPSMTSGGIENRKVLERLDELTESLNEQGEQLDQWRDKMVKLLIQPLVDQEEGMELQGDEYEVSTKHQEEVYVYMDALRATVADRHGALTGQINTLIEGEMKIALSRAKEGEGPLPALLQEVLATRARLVPEKSLGSIRGILSELRNLATALRWQEDGGSSRATAELALVEGEIQRLHKISIAQTRALAGLEKEMELFRQTMNLRLDYYRQLQQISDTVAPFEPAEDEDVDKIYSSMEDSEKKLANKVSSLKAKGRYLLHLRSESDSKETQRLCIICQQNFEVGALTVCGHQYCKDCMRLWWAQHHSCPICKRHLKLTDLHNITYKPQDLHVQEEAQVADDVDQSVKSSPSSIYSNVSTTTLNQIQNIDLTGSFGTKIDTLARHILWLREHDPGAKSLVFSQFRDFLQILGPAFQRFKIGYTSIDMKNGIEGFKNDPAIECFLLHSQAHASGLNLVNATHVFLCEPLINTAIELQAIARVHRIGQQQPTTVWMYLVKDTVEEAIYDISVARRLAHMGGRSRSVSGATTPAVSERELDAANSYELQQAPLSKLLGKRASEGEVVEKEDLWNCLFGKSRRRSNLPTSSPLATEVGRHLRATAAEERRANGQP
ncbi:hypothetical protein L228DRAFT_228741 [Xylona heveae TC161]|uniref:SNF2 family helicase/ATPase n=1 Tax=Xylona heveae (strain CBS 132557 / TC161) TaxID=1328760 RepID=A0A165IC68_XYLHT|nr:hypothetical protein L228DRAFT_228741 [Xylona heveae TC161]KZF24694.1 hypothetical protein L228DRAFT_228741 [Xylona heveae TC161]